MKHKSNIILRRRSALALGVAVLASTSGVVRHAAAETPSSAVRTAGGTEFDAAPIVSRVYRLQPVDSQVERVVVTAIAVDPRGDFLAVAGDDHVIRILNAETMSVAYVLGEGGSEKSSNPGHFDWIRTMAFDSSGARLVSAGNDGQMILWDRRRDFTVLQEIASAPALACVRFAGSGQQIAAVGFDSQVFLIGKAASTLPKLTCDCVDLRCCAYRDDGRMLAVAGRNGHLHLFDPATGNTIAEKELHSARVRDVAFMPNSGVLVSVSEDGEMVRFDTDRQTLLSRQRITSGRLFSLAIVDSHTLATAGSDDEIHLVRVGEDNQRLSTHATLIGHVGSISTLVVSNGTLISGGFDATLRRWDLARIAGPENKIALGNDSDNGGLIQAPR
ncbi:WD40 repeat domain-containing protein [Aporhodopirellula aestuarii]|uniref:WD40 repeat domain-containing protein n=1 Tax=Aporhodopirellula aestuarii TaxID=2950107 RepID=A0ABT0U1U3_9BACT|nr:WD40 repeat domain-containing protein [Aporhodopirellula aestuarii]MCM2370525.1 WD40 repeat domain-containing protein [Aporhodopirellula aestuarii]